ncbi:unnamed protein product, partial [Symbiodinium sp. KB8]
LLAWLFSVLTLLKPVCCRGKQVVRRQSWASGTAASHTDRPTPPMLAVPVPSHGAARVASPRGSQALREADLFRTCLQLRTQQRARLLADTRRAGNAVEAADIALIFALDRTDFALQQLRSFKGSEALPLDTPVRFWEDRDWRARSTKSQQVLAQRRKLREDLDEQWSQAQTALNRIRACSTLCGIAGEGSSRCRDLAAILERCESALLQSTSKCGTAQVFLDSVLPVLLGEELRAQESGGLPGADEEEVRLRLMLQDLTHHNEALHREIEEQQRHHPKPENSRDGCTDGEDFGAVACTPHDGEDSLSVQAAELRTALAEAYEELSRWQQEDPSASNTLHSYLCRLSSAHVLSSTRTGLPPSSTDRGWVRLLMRALAAAEQGLTLLKVLSNSSKVEEMAALIKVSDCLMAVGKGKTAVMRGQEAAQQCSETGDVWAGVMALQVDGLLSADVLAGFAHLMVHLPWRTQIATQA